MQQIGGVAYTGSTSGRFFTGVARTGSAFSPSVVGVADRAGAAGNRSLKGELRHFGVIFWDEKQRNEAKKRAEFFTEGPKGSGGAETASSQSTELREKGEMALRGQPHTYGSHPTLMG